MGSYFLFFLFLIRFLYDFNQRYLRCLRFRGSFLFSSLIDIVQRQIPLALLCFDFVRIVFLPT